MCHAGDQQRHLEILGCLRDNLQILVVLSRTEPGIKAPLYDAHTPCAQNAWPRCWHRSTPGRLNLGHRKEEDQLRGLPNACEPLDHCADVLARIVNPLRPLSSSPERLPSLSATRPPFDKSIEHSGCEPHGVAHNHHAFEQPALTESQPARKHEERQRD